MKKIVAIFLCLTTFALAKENYATKDDIKSVREDIKALSTQMDKRFEQMHHYMDKRFEDINRRFEMMQKQIDKRFEQVDKRFEDMNKRFDEQMSFLYIITSIFTTLTVTALGFAFWDRMTTIKRAKEEALNAIEDELNKKADRDKLEKLVAIIEDFAKKDVEFRKILEKHHLKYAA